MHTREHPVQPQDAGLTGELAEYTCPLGTLVQERGNVALDLGVVDLAGR